MMTRMTMPIILLTALMGIINTAPASDWRMSGGNIENTRSLKGGQLNSNTVSELTPLWEFQTSPETGDVNTPFDAVASTPTVDGDHVYFTNLQGFIFKLNRFTGTEIWRKNFFAHLSAPGFTISEGRVSPYITGNLVIIGNSFHVLDQLCGVVGRLVPIPGVCHSGDGAIVVALDKQTGNVVWRQQVDQHPAAKVSSSISGYGNKIFVPVSQYEEEWARSYPNIYNPNAQFGSVYPCCSARGSVAALNVQTGQILWKRYLSIGLDVNNELSSELKSLLGNKGYFGISTYGHNPTIDLKRKSLYVATSQTTTAPKAAEDCEVKRRATSDPNANIDGLPFGVTCNNLNEKLKTYGNAIVALDLNTGQVKWAFYARKYDAWNHSCDAPDWGAAFFPSLLVPVPAANAANCFYEPIGSNFGFGMQPSLVKNVKMSNRKSEDLVVAGNKDGRFFAINADTGLKVWDRELDPGGIVGGLHYGLATDGVRIYVGSANSSNVSRDKNKPFVPLQEFLDTNGLSAIGLRTGNMSKFDGDPGQPRPAPDYFLPFPGPNLVYAGLGYPPNIGYPDTFPPLIADPQDPYYFLNAFFKGPSSGPWRLWQLVNPPQDIEPDDVNVIDIGGNLKTIVGMISAVNASDGTIVWQRPAIDAIRFNQQGASASGSLTVVNDLVLAGYFDGKGTMLGLDSTTGIKKFEYHQQIGVNESQVSAGAIEAGPAVVNDIVYWGMGSYGSAPFTNPAGLRYLGGNRVIAFHLPSE